MQRVLDDGAGRHVAKRRKALGAPRLGAALMAVVAVFATMLALAPNASAGSNALQCTATGGSITWTDVGSGTYKVFSKAAGEHRYSRIEKTRSHSYVDHNYESGTKYKVRHKRGVMVACGVVGSVPPGTAPPGTDPVSPPGTDPASLPCFAADDAELDNEPNNRQIELDIDLDREGTVDLSGLAAQIGSLVEVPGTVDAEDGEVDMDWIAGSVSLRDLPRETVVTLDGEPIKLCWELKETSPIGLDLDRSGAVERITGEFAFDFNADGAVETVGEWFAPTEGILVNTELAGPFTGDHLFGDQGGLYADGFVKLARLDVNADGQVAGAELAGLGLWLDTNSNAVADAGEVQTMSAFSVVSLSTSHTAFVSTALLADGSTIVTEDLWFPVVALGAATSTPVAGWGLLALGLLAIAALAGRRRFTKGNVVVTDLPDETFDAELAKLLDEELVRGG